jgi:2'-5' RNA ligase
MRLFSRILKKLTKEFIPFILHPYSFKIQKNGFQNMVWVNFKKSPEFEELSLRISDALGYENKRKPLPHINLVRSKNKIESSLLPLVIQKEIPLGIDHVELWESHLNPKGATYFCLESFYFKS